MHHSDLAAHDELMNAFEYARDRRQRVARAFAFGDEAAWTGASPACPPTVHQPQRPWLLIGFAIVAVIGALFYPSGAPL